MLKFHIAELTCGHCVSVITKAIMQVQDDAKVVADIASATLSVNSELTAEELIEVMKDAGYTATLQKTSCCNPSNSCHA